MQKGKFPMILVFGLAILCSQAGFTLNFQKKTGDPTTLDEYNLVARGKMSRDRTTRPLQIARMDNNGEILLACLEAKTVGELKSKGIKFLPSQLELLVDWTLLEYDRKNKSYKTTIHVYGSKKASAIRRLVIESTGKLVESLNSDLTALKNHLEKNGREKSMFAVLYAYILHNYSMNQFGKEIYQKPQLSAEHPFWNGFAWAVYPTQKYPVGGSFVPGEEHQFFIVSAETLQGPRFQQFFSFVKNVTKDNKLDNPELITKFSAFGLCDKQGELTIPVFEGQWPLRLENMAKKVYAKTVELVESVEMKKILGMATQAQAAMFIHYEIRYAFLNLLLEKGLFPVPVDFQNAENNNPADVGNLVFVIRGKK
jgi:hypothetical protein